MCSYHHELSETVIHRHHLGEKQRLLSVDGNKKLTRLKDKGSSSGGQDLSTLVPDGHTLWPRSFQPLHKPSPEAKAAAGKDPTRASCGINFKVGSNKEMKPSALQEVLCGCFVGMQDGIGSCIGGKIVWVWGVGVIIFTLKIRFAITLLL